MELESQWIAERVERLRRFTDEVACRHVDSEIEEIVRSQSQLSRCRALDAIHMATALFLRPYHDEPLVIVTIDNRMTSVAQKLGFSVAPAE